MSGRADRFFDRADGVAFVLLTLLIVFGPFPLGSNRPLAWTFAAGLVGLLLVAWAVTASLRRPPSPSFGVESLKIPIILYLSVLLWAGFQLLPIFPETLAHSAWSGANDFFGRPPSGSISVDPDWGVIYLMRLLAYLAIFWLSLQYCRDTRRARAAVMAFVAACAAYSLYGLLVQLGGTRTILWYDKWASLNAVSSTFVNRNSFATYAGFGLVACVAYLNAEIRSKLRRRNTLRGFVIEVVELSGATWLMLVSAFIISVALLLSGSRGGVVSTVISLLLVLFVTLLRERFGIGAFVRGTIVLAVTGLFLGLISGGYLYQRFTDYQWDPNREKIYGEVVTAINSYPITGVGLGGFPQTHQNFRSGDKLQYHFVEKAHSTFLENTLELGIPAFVLMQTAFVMVFMVLWTGTMKRRRDHHFPAMGVGLFALASLHSTVDFSLQIPANAMTFAFLAGIAVAQSQSARKRRPV